MFSTRQLSSHSLLITVLLNSEKQIGLFFCGGALLTDGKHHFENRLQKQLDLLILGPLTDWLRPDGPSVKYKRWFPFAASCSFSVTTFLPRSSVDEYMSRGSSSSSETSRFSLLWLQLAEGGWRRASSSASPRPSTGITCGTVYGWRTARVPEFRFRERLSPSRIQWWLFASDILDIFIS